MSNLQWNAIKTTATTNNNSIIITETGYKTWQLVLNSTAGLIVHWQLTLKETADSPITISISLCLRRKSLSFQYVHCDDDLQNLMKFNEAVAYWTTVLVALVVGRSFCCIYWPCRCLARKTMRLWGDWNMHCALMLLWFVAKEPKNSSLRRQARMTWLHVTKFLPAFCLSDGFSLPDGKHLYTVWVKKSSPPKTFCDIFTCGEPV